jgi:hypothetical protein
MKKTLIITNLIWLTIFIFYACKPESEKISNVYEKSFENYKNKIPYFGTEAEVVRVLMTNYRDNRWKKIKIDDQYGEDSRSVWFSTNQLKRLMYEMESTMLANKNTAELGIRFYFTEYPDSVSFNKYSYFDDIPKMYQKRHSLLMIPTYNDGKKNIDFDFKAAFKGGRPQTFAESMREKLGVGSKKIRSQVGGSEGLGLTSADNRGGLRPPPKDDEANLGNFFK